MGTTAEKLTYLGVTKEKIRDSINLTGANIGTSDTFRSYATKLKKGYIDIINNGIDTLYNNFPKVSGIGSNLSLTPTYEAPMKLNEIQGDTYQQTYTGKNIWNVGTLSNRTDGGITFTPVYDNNELKYINMTGTATANVFYQLHKETLPAGTYKINGCTGGSLTTYLLAVNYGGSGRISQVDSELTFTLSEERTATESFIRIENGTTVNNVKIYPMIRLSSVTDSSYEPYVGGTPSPNPDYPQDIESVTGLQNVNVCGKNLIYNKNQQQSREESGIQYIFNEDGTIDVSGTATGNYNMYLMSGDSRLVLPAGTYTLSGGINSYAWVRLQSGTTYIDTSSSQPSKTFTITETTNFNVVLRIRNGESVDGVFKPQLEVGSTATTYEPYIGNTYEVNLGKNLFDINGTITQGTLDKYNNGFTLIKGTNRVIRFVLPKVLPAGTYTLSYDAINVENVSGNYFYVSCQYTNTNIGILNDIILNDSGATFTTTGEFDRLYFFIAGNQSNDATITIDNVQLEKGNTSTSFSPYFTPIELNKISDYKDSIKKSTGKNLFDKDNTSITSGAYINSSTGEIISGGTSSVINNISVISNTTYTLTAVGKNKIAFYDSNNNYLSNITSNLTTFTTPANCKYIKIQLATETLDINTIQLEIGSTATSYEPYGKVWYIEKQIGKKVYNGTETGWFKSGTTQGDRFALNVDDAKVIDAPIIMSNYFIGKRNSKFSLGTCYMAIYNTTFERLFIDFSEYNTTTLAQFKTWLSTHNTEVLYVLNTPTYTEITNTELIEDLETLYTAKSKEGTTNISITSEDLEMILNVSALKGEV